MVVGSFCKKRSKLRLLPSLLFLVLELPAVLDSPAAVAVASKTRSKKPAALVAPVKTSLVLDAQAIDMPHASVVAKSNNDADASFIDDSSKPKAEIFIIDLTGTDDEDDELIVNDASSDTFDCLSEASDDLQDTSPGLSKTNEYRDGGGCKLVPQTFPTETEDSGNAKERTVPNTGSGAQKTNSRRRTDASSPNGAPAVVQNIGAVARAPSAAPAETSRIKNRGTT